jgi:integration host factor subunit alpha
MKIQNRENTSKKNIVNNISNTVGVPFSYAKKIVDDFFSIIIKSVLITNKLKIKNFGTFNIKKKKKRVGRNPKTKVIHEISERNVLTFKTSVELNQKLNKSAKK